MFFDPQAHTARGVSYDTVIRGIRRAQMEAETWLGIHSQLSMCFLRDWSAEFAMSTLLQSLPYKEWIIGVGLDSDEKNNPPLKFAKVFQRAREEGYLLTMHCDVNQQDSVSHIWQVVRDIGVNRIDHGVNAIEDKNLCDEIKRRSLALTICPISNAYVVDGTKSEVIAAVTCAADAWPLAGCIQLFHVKAHTTVQGKKRRTQGLCWLSDNHLVFTDKRAT
jgi:adenosine deaminase